MGAHRGSSVLQRENTLQAIKDAEADPRYAFIEFDVQYTADGEIVLFHDIRLFRQYRRLNKLGEATYTELKQFSQNEIPRYSDVMDIVTKRVNVEIKSQGDDGEDRRLADELVRDIKARGRVRETMISSISGNVIRYVKERYPEFKTGQIFWLTSSTFVHLDGLTEGLYQKFNESKADYLMLHVANLRNVGDLLKMKPDNKTIIFWDFDDAIYLVHKDWNDRLWGDSMAQEFRKRLAFKNSGKRR